MTRTDRDRPSDAGEASERSDRHPHTGIGTENGAAEEGDDLAPVLAAIGDDGRRMLAVIEAGIVLNFAIRVATARQQVPRRELAAMIAALKLSQRAELTAASQRVKAEIMGRRKAVRRDRRRRLQPAKVYRPSIF